MAGAAWTDLVVGWGRGVATGIADGRGHDAGELPEILFVTPEAAETEDGGPRPVRPRTGERGPEHPVDAGLHDRVGAAGEGFSGGGDDIGLGTEETHVETIGPTGDGTVTARARAREDAGFHRAVKG